MADKILSSWINNLYTILNTTLPNKGFTVANRATASNPAKSTMDDTDINHLINLINAQKSNEFFSKAKNTWPVTVADRSKALASTKRTIDTLVNEMNTMFYHYGNVTFTTNTNFTHNGKTLTPTGFNHSSGFSHTSGFHRAGNSDTGDGESGNSDTGDGEATGNNVSGFGQEQGNSDTGDGESSGGGCDNTGFGRNTGNSTDSHGFTTESDDGVVDNNDAIGFDDWTGNDNTGDFDCSTDGEASFSTCGNNSDGSTDSTCGNNADNGVNSTFGHNGDAGNSTYGNNSDGGDSTYGNNSDEASNSTFSRTTCTNNTDLRFTHNSNCVTNSLCTTNAHNSKSPLPFGR